MTSQLLGIFSRLLKQWVFLRLLKNVPAFAEAASRRQVAPLCQRGVKTINKELKVTRMNMG